MSFSSEVKDELIRLKPEKSCCMLSEISALTQTCASLRFRGRGRICVIFETESSSLARRIFLLLKIRMNITCILEYYHVARFGGRRIYSLTLNEADSRKLLLQIHMLRQSGELERLRGVPRNAFNRKCCRSAYLRGAFEGGGSMLEPDRGYRITFASSSRAKAEILNSVLKKSGIEARLHEKKGLWETEVCRGDDVSSILAMMGASQSMMRLENKRIKREARNQANRASNCDIGNSLKQLRFSAKQTELFEAWSDRHPDGGPLNGKQAETLRIRLEHPESSLEELGLFYDPPLTKSGVYHRLLSLEGRIRQAMETEEAP